MKLKRSSISSIDLDSSIDLLCKTKKKPAYIQALKQANILKVEQLLWVTPKYIKKVPPPGPFTQAKPGEFFQGSGEIETIRKIPVKTKSRRFLCNLQVKVKDLFSQNSIWLYWFNTYPSTSKKLESLNTISFSGKINDNAKLSMTNPKIEAWDESACLNENKLMIEYPVLNKVPSHQFKKLIHKIPLSSLDKPAHNLPQEILRKNRFSSFSKAIQYFHGFSTITDSWNEDQHLEAKNRLIYEEFFWEQVKLQLQKNTNNQFKSPKIDWPINHIESFKQSLPFILTKGQREVLDQFKIDLQTGHPMQRLLQGDVGCGKTVIAIALASMVAHSNYQVAILCPTEGLATQFFQNCLKYNALNLNIDLILGGALNKKKKEQLANLKMGKTQVIVGTHALIQNKVKFKNLGLSIIDEQHKFGVNQRNHLVKQSKTRHFLLMSATPIPRSLGLTLFGNLEISTISETPNKDKKISTKLIDHQNRGKMLSFILTRLSMGEQAYIVVPSIEESEYSELINLEETYNAYRKFFPRVSMAKLHGKMKNEEKAEVLNEFKKGKIQILVSTTVIEVGIDVPNATVMTIYNPERFGLSSLHQLRGRVGRGQKPGFCFLDCLKNISKDSKYRLEKFINCKDGFDIAETDLEIRGPGDYLGNEQSGYCIKRKISDPFRDYKILVKVKKDIEHLKNNFPLQYEDSLSQFDLDNFQLPV